MRSGSAVASRACFRPFMLALFGALALVLLCVCHAPAARASSEGGVTMDHTSGPAGTVLQIGISLSVDPPQQYILAVTTTDPALTQPPCASAQPFPGLDPITVGVQGGHTQLTWPASFGPGQYWFCASPQSGSGPTAHSFQPFTVTPTPTATATPDPNQPASATAVVPAEGALPDSTVTIFITAWMTPDNAPPTTVELVSQPDASAGMPLVFSSTATTTPGTFTLSVVIPPTVTPGRYAFEVGDAYHVRTTFIDVVASDASTPAGTLIGTQRHTLPGGTSGNEGMPPIAIVLGVIALLVLGCAILVPSLLRRQRAVERQRLRAGNDAGARQSGEEAWRR